MLQKKVLWQCLRRSWSVGAAMSARHMQRVGFLYALHPALARLYPQAQALQEAKKRYLSNVRTHCVMAPLLVGIFIALEVRVARQEFPATGIQGLLHTTATTLSAIGDSFFSGTLLVLWALGCFLCFLLGIPASFLDNMAHGNALPLTTYSMLLPALLWTGFLLALVGAFRVYMFFIGVKHGLSALRILRGFDLINWAERIKLCNAALLCGIFWKITDGKELFFWGNEIWGILCMLMAVLLVQRAHVPRLILVSLLFVFLFMQSLSVLAQ